MPEHVAERPSGYALRHVLLALALLLNFRTFQFFPGMAHVQEAWFILCALAFVMIYPAWKLSKGLRFSHFELYMLATMLILVALPAWQARAEFGQPLAYGILSRRFVALVAALCLLLNGLRYRIVRIADLEGALLTAAWGTWLLYSAIEIFLNPANYWDPQKHFVLMAGGNPAFALPGEFILFGFMYYILRGARTGNAKDFLLAAILFAPTFAAGGTGRMATLSLLASLGFFLYRWLPVGRFWSIAAKFSLIAALGIGLAYAVAPAFITQRVAAYSDAFRVTLTGTEVSDVSANVRLLQVLTALPYIQKHPLLGNGVLSAQWYGGEQSLLGDLFNSSDIGLVGGVFIFGGLGLIALAYQFRFAARAARRLSPSIRSPLADATKAFLLYVAISSFSACYFAFNPEKTLFFITLLVGISLQAREQGDDFKEMGLCNPQEPALSV